MNNETFTLLSASAPLRERSGDAGWPQALEAAPCVGLTERSVFHEPWWLDAVTGGDWKIVKVKRGNETIAEMPYTLIRKGIWHVSAMPPLTRCLGPVIQNGNCPPGNEWRHRRKITADLIEQLPDCAFFHQLMDTRISDAEAIAFSLQGYEVMLDFTVKLPVGLSEADAWAGIRPNTRYLIRRARECLTTAEIREPDAFVKFYEANLAVRGEKNMYGTAAMRRVTHEFVRRGAGVLLGAYDKRGSLEAAIALVWDRSAAYYLLSSRKADAHGGAVGLLLWNGMRYAREKNLIFDFDGVISVGILQFLSGFGCQLFRRLEIRRARADYEITQKVLHGTRVLAASVSRALPWPAASAR